METATDRPAVRKSEAGLTESPTKVRLKKVGLEDEPQLRRKMSEGTNSGEEKGRRRRRRKRNLEIAMGGATVLQRRKKYSFRIKNGNGNVLLWERSHSKVIARERN